MNFLFSLAVASLSGTVIFILLVVLKPVTQKMFSKTWHYYTCFIPVFLLLGGAGFVNWLTGRIEPLVSPLVTFFASVGDSYEPSATAAVSSDIQVMPFMQISVINGGTAFAERQITSLTLPEHSTEIALGVIMVWALGAVAYFAVAFVKYLKYYRFILKDSCVYNEPQNAVRVIVSPNIATPMLLGLLKPTIALPNFRFSDEELEMILRHELIHYKRMDVLLKFVVLLANAVHWLNPAVYFLSRRINTLCELSCDETAVMEMSLQERKLYGETILSALQKGNAQRNLVLVNNFCNSKKNIERRLTNVLKAKKTRKAMVVLSLAMAVMFVAVGVFMVNAAPSVIVANAGTAEADDFPDRYRTAMVESFIAAGFMATFRDSDSVTFETRIFGGLLANIEIIFSEVVGEADWVFDGDNEWHLRSVQVSVYDPENPVMHPSNLADYRPETIQVVIPGFFGEAQLQRWDTNDITGEIQNRDVWLFHEGLFDNPATVPVSAEITVGELIEVLLTHAGTNETAQFLFEIACLEQRSVRKVS